MRYFVRTIDSAYILSYSPVRTHDGIAFADHTVVISFSDDHTGFPIRVWGEMILFGEDVYELVVDTGIYAWPCPDAVKLVEILPLTNTRGIHELISSPLMYSHGVINSHGILVRYRNQHMSTFAIPGVGKAFRSQRYRRGDVCSLTPPVLPNVALEKGEFHIVPNASALGKFYNYCVTAISNPRYNAQPIDTFICDSGIVVRYSDGRLLIKFDTGKLVSNTILEGYIVFNPGKEGVVGFGLDGNSVCVLRGDTLEKRAWKDDMFSNHTIINGVIDTSFIQLIPGRSGSKGVK